MSQPIDIHHAAKLSRLHLTKEEEILYASQLEKILAHVETLNRFDLSDVEPTAHAMPVQDVWREDVTAPSLDASDALENAPRKGSGQFVITRVVEE